MLGLPPGMEQPLPMTGKQIFLYNSVPVPDPDQFCIIMFRIRLMQITVDPQSRIKPKKKQHDIFLYLEL